MELEPEIVKQAIAEGLQEYPGFDVYGPRLVERALFQGSALMIEYSSQPPRENADAWEFQNTVVKAYKRLSGI
jgi:hypothetical protein